MSLRSSREATTSNQIDRRDYIQYNGSKPIIPDYFLVTNGYNLLKVGTQTNPYTIVNESNYDYYILAGIENNEIFSELIIKNLNIHKYCAVDTNVENISLNFPENMKILNRQLGHLCNNQFDNLLYFTEKYDNMFLKVNAYGQEYLWLLAIPKEHLLKFKQLVITFSEVNNNPTQARANNKIRCFKKMMDTHNIAFMKYTGMDLIITYIRKDITIKQPNDETDEKQAAEEAARIAAEQQVAEENNTE